MGTFAKRLSQAAFLVLFGLVPLLDVFRIDVTTGTVYVFRQAVSFSESSVLLLAVVFLVLVFVTLSQWFRRGFCLWICPHNTFSAYLLRLTRWRFLAGHPAVRQTVNLLVAAFFAPVIAFLFLAYFVDPRRLWADLQEGTLDNLLLRIELGFTLFFFVMIAFLRHRFCRYACPYGFLQMVFAAPQAEPGQRPFLRKTNLLLGLLTLSVAAALTFAVFTSTGLELFVTPAATGIPSNGHLTSIYTLTVTNLRNQPRTVRFSYRGIPPTWDVSLPEALRVGPQQSVSHPLTFRVGPSSQGQPAVITVDAILPNGRSRSVTFAVYPQPIRSHGFRLLPRFAPGPL